MQREYEVIPLFSPNFSGIYSAKFFVDFFHGSVCKGQHEKTKLISDKAFSSSTRKMISTKVFYESFGIPYQIAATFRMDLDFFFGERGISISY